MGLAAGTAAFALMLVTTSHLKRRHSTSSFAIARAVFFHVMEGNSDLYAHWTTESLNKKARFDKKLLKLANERNHNAIFQSDLQYLFKCVEEVHLRKPATSKVSKERRKTQRRTAKKPTRITRPTISVEQLMKDWSEESLEQCKLFNSALNKMASERVLSTKWLNDLRIVFCRTMNGFLEEQENVSDVADGEGSKKTLKRRHRSLYVLEMKPIKKKKPEEV
ncbi:hypothetical protein QR680_009671 [Steinernema hermaphroditum]|uniref:Uncharacterized protein n=1 Tax=Steinernema hermaphroditum TaxID=289476 RepID=A0AA39MAD6_9BILA|nr:hypothetical protein QR680_009671 [Steinernema hermaphroditum]